MTPDPRPGNLQARADHIAATRQPAAEGAAPDEGERDE